MEPGGCIDQVEAHEALHVSPVSEGIAPAGRHLVRLGLAGVMGVEVAQEDRGGGFVEVVGE